MNRIWDEIEENVDGAVQVIMDDRTFNLVVMLEKDIQLFEIRHRRCPSLPSMSGHKSWKVIVSTRVNLVKRILAKINWMKFCEEKESWFWHELCYLTAYGRLNSVKWREVLTQQNIRYSFDYIYDLKLAFGTLLLSAISHTQMQEKEINGLERAPFELWAQLFKNYNHLHMENFFDFLSNLSKSDLNYAARKNVNYPTLLTELPNFWELLFLPDGFNHKVDQTESRILSNVLIDVFIDIVKTDLMSCCLMYLVLQGFRESANLEDFLKSVIENDEFVSSVCNKTGHVWLENVDYAKCCLRTVISVYLNVFEGEFDWLHSMASRIPVPLILVGEENNWSALVKYVEQTIFEEFNGKISLETVYKELSYNRLCDWYRLLVIFPDIRNRIPVDYKRQTDVFSSWECCLLRVWIHVFGEKATMHETERDTLGQCFWDNAAHCMTDGELLHIAVEVESLLGVKKTAWPAMLDWRDKKNGKTALEISQEKWGSHHEITKFLLRRTENMDHWRYPPSDN